MKEEHLQILKCLRKNARETLTSISQQINAPISTVHDWMRSTEEYVKKYTILVDFDKVGYSIRAHILLKSDDPRIEQLALHPCINSASRLQGNFNYILDCIFRNMRDLNDFMKQLDILPVHNKEVVFVISDMKREMFLN